MLPALLSVSASVLNVPALGLLALPGPAAAQPVSWMMVEAVVSGVLLVAALVVFLLRFARGKVWMIVALAVAASDQLIKYCVTHCLPGGEKVRLPGEGRIVYYENHLLGFGTDNSDLLACTLAGILVLIMLSLRLQHMKYRVGGFAELSCALLIGGCAGILIDRIRLGYVIDWLDFGPRSDFIYNLADLAIMAGVAVGIVAAVRLVFRVRTRPAVPAPDADAAAGAAAAEVTRRRFGSLPPSGIANALGVAVTHAERPEPALEALGVRSEYRSDPPTIVLYDAPIDALGRAIRSARTPWAGVDLAEVHIAHELFHHLEGDGPVSERAAHAYAAALLRLPDSPETLDALARCHNG